jgi:hypothetical protein
MGGTVEMESARGGGAAAKRDLHRRRTRGDGGGDGGASGGVQRGLATGDRNCGAERSPSLGLALVVVGAAPGAVCAAATHAGGDWTWGAGVLGRRPVGLARQLRNSLFFFKSTEKALAVLDRWAMSGAALDQDFSPSSGV